MKTVICVALTLVVLVNAKKVQYYDPLPKEITSSSRGNLRRHNVTLLASINYGGRILPLGRMCTESIKIALEQKDEVPNLLPDYAISVEPWDDKFDYATSISAFVNRMAEYDPTPNRLPLYLGPFSGVLEYLGPYYKYFNYIGITSASPSPAIYLDRDLYDGLYVLTRSFINTYRHLKKFLNAMNWRKIGLLSDNSLTVNLMEKEFIESFANEKETIAISKYPFVPGAVPSSEQIEESARELAKHDPRIIVITSLFPARVTCWLWRLGLYGPNYIFLVLSFTAFNKYDPMLFQPWCSQTVIEEILESVIFFGVTNEMELGMGNSKDSLGLTGAKLERRLMERIENVQHNHLWWYWRTHCYDTMVTALVALNRTESTLKKRNDSLINWVTNGERFQTKGAEIRSILQKEVIESKAIKIHLGSVEFDPVTSINSIGHIWTAFSQVQNGAKMPIARINDNGQVEFGPKPMRWRTVQGLAPVDHVTVIPVEPDYSSSPAGISLSVISGILIICATICVAVLLVFWKKAGKRRLGLFNFLLGDLCILICAFLVEIEQTTPVYIAYFILIITGITLLLFGFAVFSEMATALYGIVLPAANVNTASRRRSGRKSYASSQSRRSSTIKRPSNHLHSKSDSSIHMISGKHLPYIELTILIVQIVLLTIWLVEDPIQVAKKFKGQVPSRYDDSIYYQDVTYNYLTGSSLFTTLPIAFITFIIFVITLRTIYLAISRKSRNFSQPGGYNALTACLYATIVIFIAGVVIGVLIFRENQNASNISLSITFLLAVVLNLAIIVIPQLGILLKM